MLIRKVIAKVKMEPLILPGHLISCWVEDRPSSHPVRGPRAGLAVLGFEWIKFVALYYLIY